MKSSSTQPRCRILLVEDDFDTRRMMAHVLAPFGEVLTAEDGERALEVLLDETVDLVVTDVTMPRLSGLELSRHLKADPALCMIPVIMVTARTQPEDVVAAINSGARSYVTKPFRPRELRVKVARALRSRAMHRMAS